MGQLKIRFSEQIDTPDGHNNIKDRRVEGVTGQKGKKKVKEKKREER